MTATTVPRPDAVDFTDSAALARAGDGAALRARFATDGYLFLRGLLDAAAVRQVRASVVDFLADCGWLADGSDPDEARPSHVVRREADECWYGMYAGYQGLQDFHELGCQRVLTDVAGLLLDDEVLVHPRKIGRVSLPSDVEFTTKAHQDFRLVQGAVDTLTLWLPLGDCPRDLGGLRVLAGSPRAGLRPVTPATGPGGVGLDVTDDDPAWRSIDYRAGDVVLFHSLTVHAALPNLTDRLRLSADYRYQRRSDAILQGSLNPHYWPAIPGWRSLTRGWTSTASVQAPDGLDIVPAFDAFDDAAVAPPSRLLAAGAGAAAAQ